MDRSLMFGEFRVELRQNLLHNNFKVFLIAEAERRAVFITKSGMAHTVEHGAQIKDEDELVFAEMSLDHLHAFADALANMGVKTNKDSIAEGKLEATERHLEDMRLIALSRFNKPHKPPTTESIAKSLFGEDKK